MCGIVGVFNYLSGLDADQDVVNEMSTLIKHRGPDDFGNFFEKNLGLAFRRLSIIGLKDGSQPMVSSSGRFVIVFNGEIYNYKQLRAKCELLGYNFSSASDTETILALFDLGFSDIENRLDGMFAFAVFDRVESILYLSRDNSGKKPLFYTNTPDGVCFASEQKPLFRIQKKNIQIDEQSVSDFLTLGYVPLPETICKSTSQVTPGTTLVVDGNISTKRWYKPVKRYTPQQSHDIGKTLNELISTAVEKRLQSEVPVGLFLSGGIDSSIIMSKINEIGIPEKFKAFTITFESQSYSEASSAKIIADHFGVCHQPVLMTHNDFVKVFDDCVWHADNLIANPATFAYQFLCKQASKEVKVALHGGGADELFFGYETYKANDLACIFDKFPAPIVRALTGIANRIPASHKKLAFDYKIKKFFESVTLEPFERHHAWRSIFTESEKKEFLEGHKRLLCASRHYTNLMGKGSRLTFMEKCAHADLEIWWKSMGNYQADITGMSTGLELRLPFMDKDLVSFVSCIPQKKRYSFWKNKILLKKIFKNELPKQITKLPKSGFHIPLAEWFRGPLSDFAQDYLENLSQHKFFYGKEKLMFELLDEHKALKADNSFKLINLIVLSKFIDTHFG